MTITSYLNFLEFYSFMGQKGLTAGVDYYISSPYVSVSGPYKITFLSTEAKKFETYLKLKFG